MAKSISIDQREAPKKAATSPYRLPDTVIPISYRLTIEPDLEELTYNGAVEIDLVVRVPTKKVVVNALDLKIVAASLGKAPARTSLDNKEERLTVTVDTPLQKGAATLVVRFAGAISETLRGFYRSNYVAADGSKRWLGATQFEATNARRAFPCFDEPAFKATFEVTILVPEGRTAISNMPVANRDALRVTFAPTPNKATDAYFVDSVGDDATQIVSLLDFLYDLEQAMVAIDVHPESRIFVAVEPDVLARLAVSRSTTGGRAYPELTINGGEIGGITVRPSGGLAANTMLVFDASQIAADPGTILLDSSKSATLDMAGGNTPALDLFTKNLVALRADRMFGFKLLTTGAAALVTGVNYAAESP